jgi:hypothetical protein
MPFANGVRFHNRWRNQGRNHELVVDCYEPVLLAIDRRARAARTAA